MLLENNGKTHRLGYKPAPEPVTEAAPAKPGLLRRAFNEIMWAMPQTAMAAGLAFLALQGDLRTPADVGDADPNRIKNDLHDKDAANLNKGTAPAGIKLVLPDSVAIPPSRPAQQNEQAEEKETPQPAQAAEDRKEDANENIQDTQCTALPHRCTLALTEGYAMTFTRLADFEAAQKQITTNLRTSFKGLPIPPEVNKALITASIMTPYSYDYWVGKAYAESKFDAEAFNKSTKARGLFQFLPKSAMEILYYMGKSGQYGFIPETEQVERKTVKTKGGKRKFVFEAAEGVDQQELLKTVLNDPLKSAFMAAEYNERYLKSLDLPKGMEATTLTAYIVHWQGNRGAQKLYDAYENNPNQAAWRVFAKSTRATIVQDHKSLFFTRNGKGRARTLKELLGHLAEARGIGNTPLENEDSEKIHDATISPSTTLEPVKGQDSAKATSVSDAFAPAAAPIEHATLGVVPSPLMLAALVEKIPTPTEKPAIPSL